MVLRLRGQGYAGQVCAFAAWHIRSQGHLAAIRTVADNLPMGEVIPGLGFLEQGPAGKIDINTL